MPREDEIVDLTDSPVAQQRPTIDDDSNMSMNPLDVKFGPDNADPLEDEEGFGQGGDYQPSADVFAPWTSLTNFAKSMAEESLGSTSRESSSSSSSSNSSVAMGSENSKSGQARSSQSAKKKNGKSIIGYNHRRSMKSTTGSNKNTHENHRKVKDARAGEGKKVSSNPVKPPGMYQRKNPSESTKKQWKQNHPSKQILSSRQTSSNGATPILLHQKVALSRKRKLPEPGHNTHTSEGAIHIDMTEDSHICTIDSSSPQMGRHIRGNGPKFQMHASYQNSYSNASDRTAISNHKSDNKNYESDANLKNNLKINQSKDTAFGQDGKVKGSERVFQREKKNFGIIELHHRDHEMFHSPRNRNQNNNDQLPNTNTHLSTNYRKRWWGAHGKDRHQPSSQDYRNNSYPTQDNRGDQQGGLRPDYGPVRSRPPDSRRRRSLPNQLPANRSASLRHEDDESDRIEDRTTRNSKKMDFRECGRYSNALPSSKKRRVGNIEKPAFQEALGDGNPTCRKAYDAIYSTGDDLRFECSEPKTSSCINEPESFHVFEEGRIVNVDCFGRPARPMKRRHELQTNDASNPLVLSKSDKTNIHNKCMNRQGLCSATTIGRMEGRAGEPKAHVKRFSRAQSQRTADPKVGLNEDTDDKNMAFRDKHRKRLRLSGVDENKTEQSMGCKTVNHLGIDCIELEGKEERKDNEPGEQPLDGTRNSCNRRGETRIETENSTTSVHRAQSLLDASHDAGLPGKSEGLNDVHGVFESQAMESHGRAPTEQCRVTNIDSSPVDSSLAQCRYPEATMDATSSHAVEIEALKSNKMGEGIIDEKKEDSAWLSPAVDYWVGRALKAIEKANKGKTQTKPIENFEASLASEVKASKTNKHRPKGFPSADLYVKKVVKALRQDHRLAWGNNNTGIVYWSGADPAPLPCVSSNQFRIVQERVIKLIFDSMNSRLEASSLPKLYKQVHMVDLDYKGLGFTKLRALLDTIPAIQQQTHAQGSLTLSVPIEQTNDAVREDDDLLCTVRKRIVGIVSKNSELQACSLPEIYRHVHMVDLDYKGLGFKKLKFLLNTIPTILQTHIQGNLMLSIRISRKQTAEKRTEGLAAHERMKSPSIFDRAENPQCSVACQSLEARHSDAESSPQVGISQDKDETNEEINVSSGHVIDSTNHSQSLTEQNECTKPYFREFPPPSAASKPEVIRIDVDEDDGSESTNRRDCHKPAPNDDGLDDEAPHIFGDGKEEVRSPFMRPVRDSEDNSIYKEQTDVPKVGESAHDKNTGRTKSGFADPGASSTTTNQTRKDDDIKRRAGEIEGSNQSVKQRVAKTDTIKSLSDCSSQSKRFKNHSPSNRSFAHEKESNFHKLPSVLRGEIPLSEQQSCKKVELVNPLKLKFADASLQQTAKIILEKPRFKPQKPKSINRTRKKMGSEGDKKDNDNKNDIGARSSPKERTDVGNLAGEPSGSTVTSENTTGKAGSSNLETSAGSVKETRYVFHESSNNKNDNLSQSSRRGAGSRCFDSRSFFSFVMSNEDAEKEQERLFKESAERMKASAAKFKTVSNNFDHHRLKPSSVSFSQPIRDVEKRHPNHWRFANPHSRLGLPKDASIALIKKHYRRLALVYHPDKSKNDPDSTLKFQHVTEAYRKLLDA